MTDDHMGADEGTIGEIVRVRVDDLLLDPENPRFPTSAELDQQDLVAKQIADEYDALDIARKIATQGFHAAEPPAIMRLDDGGYLVLEGNRRVTALKGLLSPELRATFADRRQWDSTAKSVAGVPTTIPAVLYPSREAAHPLLGARHIRGPKKWEPLMKARWITERLDRDRLSFKATAELSGDKITDIKVAYRNYRLLAIEAPALGIPTPGITDKFTVIGLALANKTLREHAGVVPDAEVAFGEPALTAPGADGAGLRELLLWILGDERTAPVLTESRRIIKLAQAVAAPEGLAVLRRGGTLAEALQAVAEAGATPLETSTRILIAANNQLRRVVEHLLLLEESDQPAVIELLDQVEVGLREARESLGEPH